MVLAHACRKLKKAYTEETTRKVKLVVLIANYRPICDELNALSTGWVHLACIRAEEELLLKGTLLEAGLLSL